MLLEILPLMKKNTVMMMTMIKKIKLLVRSRKAQQSFYFVVDSSPIVFDEIGGQMRRVRLSVSDVESVTCFPGQIVAVRGTNPTGNV